MSVSYHVYAGDASGGPVAYATPLGATTGLSFAPAPLAPGTTQTFAVRAFDPATGLEEANVDAAVTVVTDAAGRDVTGRPAPPVHLTAAPAAGAALRVAWRWAPPPGALPPVLPAGFRVYRGAAGAPAPDYATPAATIPYRPGRPDYQVTLTGLADGGVYVLGVRAYNAAAEEPNAVTVTATADGTGPLPVDGLAAAATGRAG